MDYGYFYRESFEPESDWPAHRRFDLFISAYNLSERVRFVFDRVQANEKLWILHDEYDIDVRDHPDEACFKTGSEDESSFCNKLADFIGAHYGELKQLSICIDSTGMLRPHLLFFIKLLKNFEVPSIYVTYAEPVTYKNQENTKFSAGAIYEVRPVQGFEGTPATDTNSDLMIIGMGFDDRMIAEVAEDRAKADKHQVFGLPSLSADMYQQSVLRSRKAADELSDPNFSENKRSFAPANDPFGTASVLSEIVETKKKHRQISNLYLAPLGTKPQVIGFGLYHIFECDKGEAALMFPFSRGYSAETGKGISKVWLYRIEF